MQANTVALDARISARDELRFTPAGVPAIEIMLIHESTQMEAGFPRKVACELAAIALGPLAQAIAPLAVGEALRCHGFLARRYRTGSSLSLHLTGFEVAPASN